MCLSMYVDAWVEGGGEGRLKKLSDDNVNGPERKEKTIKAIYIYIYDTSDSTTNTYFAGEPVSLAWMVKL